MLSKVERERAALRQAEAELEERRKRFEELQREEADRELQKLIKKVSPQKAIVILKHAIQLNAKRTIEVLEAALKCGASKAVSGTSEAPAEAQARSV